MDKRSLSPHRFKFALSPLPCVFFAASLALLPVRGIAQTSDTTDKTDTTSKTDMPDKSAPQPARNLPEKAAPAPANPLVLVNPQDGSGNGLRKFDKDGRLKRGVPDAPLRDYTQRSGDPRAVKPVNDLPVFGYSFFAPARRTITARNNAMMRWYGSDDFDGNPAPPSRPVRGRGNPGRNFRSGAQQNDGSSLYDPGNGLTPSGANRRRNGNDQNSPNGDQNSNQDTLGADNTDDTTSQDDGEQTAPGRYPRRTQAATGVDDGTDDGTDTATRTRRSAQTDTTDNTDTTQEIGAAQPTQAERLSRTQRLRARQALGGAGAAGASNPSDGSGDNYADDSQYPAPGNSSGRLMRPPYEYNGGGNYGPNGYYGGNGNYGPGGYYGGNGGNGNYEGFSPYPQRDANDNRPVDAHLQVADPITMLYNNIIASPPANYQLAGGDTVSVRYWSPTMAARSFTGTVNPQGELGVEGVPVVVLGQNLSHAQTLIQERLRRLYRNVEVSVTLSQLRTIPVTVSGEAFVPGTYTVPAIASAFNVLWMAGGPAQTGSLRSIEVHRQGKLIGTLDLYKFLMGGAQSDIRLQGGDMIVIPPAQSYVALRGEVRHEARFELKSGESLKDAINFAGGVKPSGVDQFVQVNTLNPGTSRVLKSVNLRDTAAVAKTALYDGDAVDVYSVRPYLVNKVTVEGAVDQPSDYPLEDGMHVADLVNRARGPLTDAYLNRAELYRWNPDNTTTLIPVDLEKAMGGDPKANLALTRWDRLKVYTREEVAWTGTRKVTVSGAVLRPGVYSLSGNTHLSDLMLMVGGPKPDAFLDRAVLLHQNGDGSFKYDFVSLADAVHGNAKADVAIQDNDMLAVYRDDQASFTPERLVTVRGEVVAPGIYPRGEDMKLSTLLTVAGGFKPDAGSQVKVARARQVADSKDSAVQTVMVTFDSQGRCAAQDDMTLHDGDVVTVQGTGGFMDHVQVITVKGAVNQPGPIVLTSKKMRLSDAIREAGGLRPEAFAEGAEFVRDPRLMTTTGQRDIVAYLTQLSNLLNQSDHDRLKAKAQVDVIKATGAAAADSTPLGGASAGVPNPAAAAVANNLAQSNLVSPARELKDADLQPNGTLAVNLPEAMRRPGGDDDILLVDGDTITVPEKPTTVQVVGAVNSGRGVPYKPGERMDYYISLAGGFATDAATDRIFVIHLGGGLLPANKVREIRPGDVILVTNKVLAAKIASHSNGVDSFFKSLTNSAIIFKLATGIFGL